MKTIPLIGVVILSSFSTIMAITPEQSTLITDSSTTQNMDTLNVNLNQLKRDSWSVEELENVKVAADFIEHLMMKHDFVYLEKHYMDHPYVQHSRGISDGMSGLFAYVKDITKRFPEYTYDVKHITVDGDRVTFHSHATIKKKHRGNDTKGFNIIDTWRIKDGQIVEHWDAIQPLDGSSRLLVLLTGGKVRNANGLF